MDNEFVTLEIAKKLKELGFNERCMAADYYADGTILIDYAEEGITNKQLDKLIDECNKDSSSNGEELLSYSPTIPLWQQAIDWLRKKHKLHITVTSISQDSWQWHITKPGESLGKVYDEDFYTYETAREDAIKEALKLIKKHNGKVTTNRKR